MTIYSVYVVNKAGGLIFQYDHQKVVSEMEKTFRYLVFHLLLLTILPSKEFLFYFLLGSKI